MTDHRLDTLHGRGRVVGFVGYAGPATSTGDLARPPARYLADALREVGWSLVPIDQLTRAPDALISFNHHDAALGWAQSLGIPKGRLMLVLFEPPAVRPDQHRTSLWRRYGLVIAPSPSWASAAGGVFLPWPQDLALPKPGPGNRRRDRRAALMNANKWSATADSMYGLRRQVIQRARRRGVDLDVYGDGWGRHPSENIAHMVSAAFNAGRAGRWPLRPEILRGVRVAANWCGVAADKLETLAEYHLSVVVENSPTYVSEKLFDALRAGTVPVYVGPPLGDFGIPADIAVQVPARAAAILEAVSDLGEEDIRKVRETGAAFLAAELTHETWGARQVASRLAAIVVESSSAPDRLRGGG